MLKNILRYCIFLSLALVIVGCGGGSGGPDTSTPVSTPTPTPTPTATPTPAPTPSPAFSEFEKAAILFTQVPDASAQSIQEVRGTGVFWGHMPSRNIESDSVIAQWVSQVSNFRNMGLDYFGRGEFDWGWAWFIDFEDQQADHWVQNLDGDFVRYEFMGQQSYMGFDNNWVSHHSPRFKDFMFFQIDRMFEAPITRVMFDSQTSATRAVHWFGGDFSPYAMSGFRGYLDEKYSDAELNDLEIPDIDTFDYKDFLLVRSYTVASYKNAAGRISGNIPLYEDYVLFNRAALNTVMAEVFAYVDTKQPGIPIGSTTSIIEPRGFIFSERMSFIAGELAQQASINNATPIAPILDYKAAEALGKTLVFFPFPFEWAALQERNTPRHARNWIAQAYAMGAVFTAPDHVWVGGATGVWRPGVQNYSDLYQFIDDNAELFNGYRPLSNVGWVYSMMASLDSSGFSGSANAKQSVDYLVKNNISFDLLVFGDKGKPVMPSENELNIYDVIFVDNDRSYLTAEQETLLQSVSAKVVSYNDRQDVEAMLGAKIDVLINGVEQNATISALPRVSSDANDPYVIHLVNRLFDPNTDDVPSQNNVSIKLSPNLFPRTITTASLHEPGRTPRAIGVESDTQGNIVLQVGDFELWGILVLE